MMGARDQAFKGCNRLPCCSLECVGGASSLVHRMRLCVKCAWTTMREHSLDISELKIPLTCDSEVAWHSYRHVRESSPITRGHRK
jgi:hypothetical protein